MILKLLTDKNTIKEKKNPPHNGDTLETPQPDAPGHVKISKILKESYNHGRCLVSRTLFKCLLKLTVYFKPYTQLIQN